MERCCFDTTRITEFLFFLRGFLVALLAWRRFKASLLAVLFFLYILSNSVLAYASAFFLVACKLGFNEETTTAHQPCLCLLILHPWVSAAILPQHLKITWQLLNLVKLCLFQTMTSWQKQSQGLDDKLHWIFAATNLDGVF